MRTHCRTVTCHIYSSLSLSLPLSLALSRSLARSQCAPACLPEVPLHGLHSGPCLCPVQGHPSHRCPVHPCPTTVACLAPLAALPGRMCVVSAWLGLGGTRPERGDWSVLRGSADVTWLGGRPARRLAAGGRRRLRHTARGARRPVSVPPRGQRGAETAWRAWCE